MVYIFKSLWFTIKSLAWGAVNLLYIVFYFVWFFRLPKPLIILHFYTKTAERKDSPFDEDWEEVLWRYRTPLHAIKDIKDFSSSGEIIVSPITPDDYS